MSMLNTIFKAYDIRGTYPDQLNEDVAYSIGKAFVSFLQCEKLVLGHDMRTSAPSLTAAFVKGATEMGAQVVMIGQVCTDATYFASGKLNLPAAMFTASHNPPEYNGMKFSKAGAVPMNEDTGLQDMKSMVAENKFSPVNSTPGKVEEVDVLPGFVEHVHSFINKDKLKKLKIAVDAGNGMGGKIVPLVYENLPIEIVPLFFELDGTFPNHQADPSKRENLKWLQEKVKEGQCDFGMAFDGDADRIFFVDEKGDIVNSSLMTSLIAKNMLGKNPGSKVIYNVVCSHIVPDTVKKYGGEPILERVGHSFIKETMAKTDAVFGGEHSAHYYYRDNYRADSGIITSVIVAEVLSEAGKPLSQLLDEFRVYHTIEETNSKVADKDAKIKELKEYYTKYNPKNVNEMDGITIDFGDWWFNVRPSNTEPLLRLNLEAASEEMMNQKKEEVLGIIRK